ncbi:MAG: hypothetical protein MUD17_08555 [Gemmatimonadaceae bacterium]|jgi:hypothetical protein|nr:hypothetical protein [Gemmatimonadaceae bacterium]
MFTARMSLALCATMLAISVSPLAAQQPRADSTPSLGDLPRRDRVTALNDRTLATDLAAFDKRAKGRKGVFLAPEELDRRDPLLFQDILAGRGDLIAVQRDNSLRMRTLASRSPSPAMQDEPGRATAAGATPVVARSLSASRAGSDDREPFCTPEVFIDNLWITRDGAPVSLTRLDEQWGASAVVAVEIYESPWQIPDAFGPVMRGGSCGLVAFWTSRRPSANPVGAIGAP